MLIASLQLGSKKAADNGSKTVMIPTYGSSTNRSPNQIWTSAACEF